MATTYDNDQEYEVGTENEDDELLHKFLYDDYTVEDLSDESGDSWCDTYHTLLGKLDDAKGEW